MSGRKFVNTIPGNTSFFPRSIYMFQPVVPFMIDVFLDHCDLIALPGFTKLMWCCWRWLFLSFFRSIFSQSATTLSTLSWRYLNFPCVSAVEQEDRICSGVHGWSHSLHVGSVVSPYRQRFLGMVGGHRLTLGGRAVSVFRNSRCPPRSAFRLWYPMWSLLLMPHLYCSSLPSVFFCSPDFLLYHAVLWYFSYNKWSKTWMVYSSILRKHG